MPRRGKEHHIDSSVIIGVFLTRNEADRMACVDYCNLVGRRYTGNVSIETLGEVVKKFGQSLTDNRAREEAFLFLGDFIFKQKLGVAYTTEDDLGLVRELRKLNYKAHVPELISLAIAIRSKADVFMTLDDDLLENERFRAQVKKRYNIAVRKPRSV